MESAEQDVDAFKKRIDSMTRSETSEIMNYINNVQKVSNIVTGTKERKKRKMKHRPENNNSDSSDTSELNVKELNTGEEVRKKLQRKCKKNINNYKEEEDLANDLAYDSTDIKTNVLITNDYNSNKNATTVSPSQVSNQKEKTSLKDVLTELKNKEELRIDNTDVLDELEKHSEKTHNGDVVKHSNTPTKTDVEEDDDPARNDQSSIEIENEKERNMIMNLFKKMMGERKTTPDIMKPCEWSYLPPNVVAYIMDKCIELNDDYQFIWTHDVKTTKLKLDLKETMAFHMFDQVTNDLSIKIYEDLYKRINKGIQEGDIYEAIQSIRLPKMLIFATELNTNNALFTKTITLQHEKFIGPLNKKLNAKSVYVLRGLLVRNDEKCLTYIRKNDFESGQTLNRDRWYKCDVTGELNESTNVEQFTELEMKDEQDIQNIVKIEYNVRFLRR